MEFGVLNTTFSGNFEEWVQNWFIDPPKWDNQLGSWHNYCATVIWLIWKARCKQKFENIIANPIRVVNQIRGYITTLESNSLTSTISNAGTLDNEIDNLYPDLQTNHTSPCQRTSVTDRVGNSSQTLNNTFDQHSRVGQNSEQD